MRDALRAIFGNSLLAKFGRRYADSFRDAGAFIDQINGIKRVIPDWRARASALDRNQIEVAQRALDELRTELRALSKEMAVAEGHMAEAGQVGETLFSRLATGAHLSQPENLALLIEGDIEGLAQYLNHTRVVEKALAKVSPEQKAILLEALLKDK